MKTFFKNLFGTQSNQAKRTQNQRRQNTFRPQIEALEDRMLMAAKVFHPPVVAAEVQQIQLTTSPVISNINPVVTAVKKGKVAKVVHAPGVPAVVKQTKLTKRPVTSHIPPVVFGGSIVYIQGHSSGFPGSMSESYCNDLGRWADGVEAQSMDAFNAEDMAEYYRLDALKDQIIAKGHSEGCYFTF